MLSNLVKRSPDLLPSLPSSSSSFSHSPWDTIAPFDNYLNKGNIYCNISRREKRRREVEGRPIRQARALVVEVRPLLFPPPPPLLLLLFLALSYYISTTFFILLLLFLFSSSSSFSYRHQRKQGKGRRRRRRR